MAIFSIISAYATAVLGPGALSLFGLSPAVTAAVVSVGRSVLWSMAGAALTKPNLPRQQVMATITQTDTPRVRAYGRNLLAGQRAFFEAADGQLYQIIVMHHGRVDGLIRFWWDGEPVVTLANGDVDPKYKRNYFRDGNGNGGDYSGIPTPNLQTLFQTLWTADHRLEGQATFLTVFGDPPDEDFGKKFPKGAYTQVQAEIRASRVANMAGAMIYSENSALCIRDLMTHVDGWNIALDRLDTSSWQAFVNRCGQAVPLAGGGTEMRYRLCGFYTLDDQLKDVTARMLATCDGQIYETAEGKIGILGGAWSEPDVTITADDILSIEMQDGFDPFTDYNVLKSQFVSPDHGYQPTSVAEWRDEDALVTQPERAEQFDVDMCPSHTQLQRLRKIKVAKDRRDMVGTIRTNLVGLKARFPKGDGIHTIRVQAEEFGIDGVFEVTSHLFSIPDGYCEIGIASIQNPYGWSVTEELPLPPTIDELGKPPRQVPPPTGASLTQIPVLLSGDTYGGKLRLTVAPVTRGDLTLQAQVGPGNVSANASVAWATMAGDRFSAETGILPNEEVYTVRYRWRGQGDWIKAGSVTIVANPNVPAAPTGFARVGSSGAQLTWTNPATNFFKSRLFRNSTNSFAGASFVADISGLAGQSSSYTDSPGTGPWHYWVVAMNGSAVVSPPAGPVSITL
ncbi:hypothetical protein PARHAE_00767 [Paracoccus haematequi]|uniref:Tip attachment protein J domain-containing protein n=1 Tax=Paracoccus haematequi TaxID=2491866 RepID=A0A3S4GLQ8_9RHOB|nr:hypothetical protein [Paracoccus haematequi]VDS07590.1 hypothetical protein PARHAE_00767 [Paracoccus haematequi]